MISKLFYQAGCLFRLGAGTLLFIVVLVLVNHFVGSIDIVSGTSMFPNFHDHDVIILDKIDYLIHKPQRGDVVVLRFPGDPDHERYIKRVLGLPGETVTIRDGQVAINDHVLYESYLPQGLATYPATSITLGPDQYFMVGDNRDNSSDSRIWGPAGLEDIIGRAYLIVWPFNRFSAVPQPIYP